MNSLWTQTADTSFEGKNFSGDIRTDVLIIGGGMSGIVTAHMLKEVGIDCVLVEGNRIGSGVTQNTTAKVTAQHGLIYADLIQKKGIEKASLYFEANRQALKTIWQIAVDHSCDIENKNAYIYSSEGLKNLEREADAYDTLGISGELVHQVDLPIKTYGALRMDDQAQFHPLKFLYGLASELDIYENTFIEKIEDGLAIVRGDSEDRGTIRARNIILCTHYPLVNIPGMYFMKLTQERSYVVAVEDGPQINGMFLNEVKEGFSFRNYGNFLLIGGGNHATGHKGAGYRAPVALAQKTYPGKSIPYTWATQDCMSLDHVPYIGRFTRGKKNLFVATGFNKWGMTGSMVAASVLCDLLAKGKSEFEDLFCPSRSMLHPRLGENILNATLGMVGFRKRCPHMGCALRWNDQEKSWDCPCHGSRFDGTDGHVLDNPAKKGITIKG